MADVNLSVELLSNVSESFTTRVRKFGFGDGYEQIAEDGINSRITEYSITTRPLSDADAIQVEIALVAASKGDYLVMTLRPFSTSPRRFRLKDNSYNKQFMKGPSDNPIITTNGQAYVIYQFDLVEAYSS
tara:strand:+ start:32 stop:421 length:390 start_codon:yes stop_codon:yes gene_type:complete